MDRGIDDKIFELDIYSSKCSECRHFDWTTGSCKAFDEIPGEYLSGEKVHDTVVKGQKGKYVFSENKEE